MYEGKIIDGNILICVHIEDSRERARAKSIFERGGVTDIATLNEERVSSRRGTGVGARV